MSTLEKGFGAGPPEARLGEAPADFAQVQHFLRRFGYLPDDPEPRTAENPDAAASFGEVTGTLDAETSTALARYQQLHALPITGLFDADTREMMTRARCLLPDPEPGIGPRSSVTCAWKRTAFTFAFDAGTADITGDDERQAVRNAFITWSAAAPIAFREVAANQDPDILIRWGNSKCGDADMSATASGDVLAHADYPPGCGFYGNARPRPIHFDDQEHNWVIGAAANSYDVETVALHEIGHILGLQHSSAGTVMQPSTAPNSTKRVLTADDVEGVRRLYPPTTPLFVKHSGKCLDIRAGSAASGAEAIQWDFWGGNNQKFRLEWVEAGYYRIIAEHSGKVLDIRAGSAAAGADIIQWDYTGGNNQRFRLDPIGHGYYRIVAKHSNRVLDVSGGVRDSGARIIQWDRTGGDNQHWRIDHAPITAVHSGKVLDVSQASLAAGAPVIQWDYWGGANQRMRLDPVGDGYYRIMIEHSGLCLDVQGISMNAGARIHQWPYWGGDNQKWRPEGVGNGHIKFVAKHSGLCLDVSGGFTDRGAQLIQWPYKGSANQQWRL